MAGGCKITSQSCMVILGFIFWGAAAAFIYVGAYVFKSYGHYDDIATSQYTLIPAIILIAVGGVMLVAGIMGCVGACNKNRCLLSTFFLFLLVIFSFEVAAGILGYVYKQDVESSVKDGLSDALQKYGRNNSTSIMDQVDYMQTQLKCCGITNYTDWMNTTFEDLHPGLLPLSCCEKAPATNDTLMCSSLEPHHTNSTLAVHTEGCYKEVKDKFQEYLVYIAGIATAFAIVQIIGMVSACVLLWQKRDAVPYANLSGSGFTV